MRPLDRSKLAFVRPPSPVRTTVPLTIAAIAAVAVLALVLGLAAPPAAAADPPKVSMSSYDPDTRTLVTFDLELVDTTADGFLWFAGERTTLGPDGTVHEASIRLPLSSGLVTKETLTTGTGPVIGACHDVVVESLAAVTVSSTRVERTVAKDTAGRELTYVETSGTWPAEATKHLSVAPETFVAGALATIDIGTVGGPPVSDLPNPSACADSFGNDTQGCGGCCNNVFSLEMQRCDLALQIDPNFDHAGCQAAARAWLAQCRQGCVDADTWPDPSYCGEAHCDDTNACIQCCVANANDMNAWCDLAFPGATITPEWQQCRDNVQDWLGWCLDDC